MKSRKGTTVACPSAATMATNMLLSFLALSATPARAFREPPILQTPLAPVLAVLPPEAQQPPSTIPERTHDFTLRHIFHHGTYQNPQLHRRLDVYQDPSQAAIADDAQVSRADHYIARSRPIEIQRLSDRSLAAIDSHLRTARLTGEPAALGASAWTTDELPGPNVSDKDTVLTLARMAANAYVDVPGQGEWEEVGDTYNRSAGFGWEEDGLRGYIFADKDNSTVIMGLKGTSMAVFDGSETTTNDKLNDNLYFSCCCGQGGQYLWRQVCDCQSSTYTCNSTCLVKELKSENRYYRASIELFTNVTKLYPDSNLWLTGHSLGGSLGGLLGLTFGVPVVGFEAPGDDLPAKRLGLPSPPDADPQWPNSRRKSGTTHFGHTADPVFMGSCNGAAATCTFGGYAMESQCHTGNVCIYDTVEDLGWRVGIGNHRIHVVIDSVLSKYDHVPSCETDSECIDCFNWKYFESNGTETTTSKSSSSTSTRTRTTTCETPGWWGCLDQTTTTTSTSTSTTTTSITSPTSTSSCETPGWFGCNDPTTSTSSSSLSRSAKPLPTLTRTSSPTSSAPSSSGSSTCQNPGWFGGCDDPTSTTTHPAPTSTRGHKSHSCETPGWFWGCYDRTTLTPTNYHSITAPPTATSTASTRPSQTTSRMDDGHCTKRRFFGLICIDDTKEEM